MDISPSSIVRFTPEYTYYISPRKSPDRLMLDWEYQIGEFSVWVDLMFEKHLKWMMEAKARVNRFSVLALV